MNRSCASSRLRAEVTSAASVAFCAWLLLRTATATSSVISPSSAARSAASSSPASTTRFSAILMLTSWSEVSTPAELSIASVFTRPPVSAYSTRPRWVSPRLPPSPTTRARSCSPSTRTASLALSPTSSALSVEAFT